jgi:hypothetical protein
VAGADAMGDNAGDLTNGDCVVWSDVAPGRMALMGVRLAEAVAPACGS